MKYIKSVVTIVALFGVASAHAKQVGKQTTPVTQPKPTPVIPQPGPIIRQEPRPVIIPQPEAGPTYSEILYSLQKKKPDSSDISNLRNIKHEAERQIEQIQASVNKKPISQPQEIPSQVLTRAEKIFKTHAINFDKTQQQIDAASKTDTDLFTKEEQLQIINAIYFIVTDLAREFPTLSSQYIYNVIIQHHPGFNTLAKKLTKEQYDDTINFLQQAVHSAYKINKT
jgi:hypothetical protein